MPSPVSEKDTRALVHLVAKIAQIRTNQETARNHLMKGLLQILPASRWSWMLVSRTSARKPLRITKLCATEQPPSPDVFESALHSRWPCQIRETRPSAALTDPVILEDRMMFSTRPLNLTELSVISVFRDPREPVFSTRECDLFEIVANEVRWLHGAGWYRPGRAKKLPSLAPRRKQVLDLLISGNTRNEIAETLGISTATASDYVKQIFSMFRVSSQAELMARFLKDTVTDNQTDSSSRSAVSEN